MNHKHQPKTISSLSHTESDPLPPIGEEKLKQFSIDKRRRWCCASSFTKPFFSGTLHGECRPPSVSWSRLHFIIHQFVFFVFRLKAMILSLKCLLFLVIVLTVLQNCVSAEHQEDEKLPADRFYDKDFLPNNWLYNRNVTCGTQFKSVFPARTWTCANIRVNGRKIAYGHYPFKSGFPYSVGRCFETEGRDFMGGICLGLMENVNETAKLWVASVTNATCGYTNDHRVLLTIDSTIPDSPEYVWDDLQKGFGWVETLHCLTLPDGY